MLGYLLAYFFFWFRNRAKINADRYYGRIRSFVPERQTVDYCVWSSFGLGERAILSL